MDFCEKARKTHRHSDINVGQTTKFKIFHMKMLQNVRNRKKALPIEKGDIQQRRAYFLCHVKRIYDACHFYDFACKMFAIIIVNFMLRQTFCNRWPNDFSHRPRTHTVQYQTNNKQQLNRKK